ncbi:MAG TPA: type II secretion system F family protein [Scandinavium sp.]|jgi:type II secretory pathway component PulF
MSEHRFVPARSMTLFQWLRYRLLRRTFNSRHRQPFYETLRFLLENGKPEEEALRMIGDVHTDFGRHWHPLYELVLDCQQALGDNRPGHQIQDVFALWIPQEEAALLSAGLRTGQLPVALAKADKLIGVRRRIHQQVIFASTYPLVLVALFSAMLVVNSEKLIPVLSKMSSPSSWTGALGLMNGLAEFTRSWGMLSAIAACMMLGLAFWSLPRWTGWGREYADRLLPWSLYADLQGAVFLMNLASLLDAGLPEIDVLESLRKTASPWLRERLDAAMAGIRRGHSTGMALRHSGFGFPDRQSVNYLSLLGKGKGASVLISRYAERALDGIIARVSLRASAARVLSLLLILLFFALMGEMAWQIQEMSRVPMH